MYPEGLPIARTEVLAELQRLRQELADVDGSVVATTDGMVIAHDLVDAETYGVQPEGVAALAAVSLGLSQRIADTANRGELRDLVIRGALGQVVSFAVGERALLSIIMSSSDHDLSALRARGEPIVRRLAELLDDNWQDDAATWESPANLAHDPRHR